MKNERQSILLVAYYWPPASGPGVQRVKELASYLEKIGKKVIILTSTNRKVENFTKDDNVIRIFDPIPETTSKGKSFYSSHSIKQKAKAFIRGNFLIPDAKIFWAKKAKSYLSEYKSMLKIDLCIVSGPPQSCHLIGAFIKKEYQVPTIHDLRDPWVDAFFLKDFYRSKLAELIDKKLERNTLKDCDLIITVSQTILNDFKKKFNRKEKDLVIYNGFMDPIFPSLENNAKKIVSYTGTISESQIPYRFLDALKELDLKLEIIGTVHPKMLEYIATNKLESQIEIKDKIDHSEVKTVLEKAQLFLLLIPNLENNEGILTGKIFEYLAANRPIIGFGPVHGEAAEILEKSGNGNMFSFDSDSIAQEIQSFLSKDLKANVDYINRFHRHQQFEKLRELLDTI